MTDPQFRAWLRVRSEGFTNRIGLLTKSGKPRLSPRKLVENLHMTFNEARERLDTIPSLSPSAKSAKKATSGMIPNTKSHGQKTNALK